MIKPCPSCDKYVSDKAFDCPKCGHPIRNPKRGFFGVVFKWAFIAFNVLMVIWFVTGLASVGNEFEQTKDEFEQAGMAIGATIGVTFILVIWVLGDIILGLATLLTRPRK